MRTKSADFSDEDVQGMTPLPVVPLIDCFVLILVFFLTCASVTKPHREVPIIVGHTSVALQPEREYKPVVIEVRGDGAFYVNYIKIGPQLLQEILREMAAADASQMVRIDGDRKTAWQHIVRVLDLCRYEGLKNIVFRTGD